MAQPTALLQSMLSHIESLENYSMMVYLQAEGNEWLLQYRCTHQNEIRVEVLDGPMKGTVASYSAHDPQHVKVHFGDGANCAYATTKLQGTPIVESVFDMLAGEIQHNQVSVKAPAQLLSVDVGRPLELVSLKHSEAVPALDDGVIGRADTVAATPLQHHCVARRTVQHNCVMLEGHLKDITQELAVDANTLEPVQVKVYRNKRLEGVAEVWDFQACRPTATLP